MKLSQIIIAIAVVAIFQLGLFIAEAQSAESCSGLIDTVYGSVKISNAVGADALGVVEEATSICVHELSKSQKLPQADLMDACINPSYALCYKP